MGDPNLFVPFTFLMNIYTTLPQVILMDIGLACMQASPDLAHGARVQITLRLEENRRKN